MSTPLVPWVMCQRPTVTTAMNRATRTATPLGAPRRPRREGDFPPGSTVVLPSCVDMRGVKLGLT